MCIIPREAIKKTIAPAGKLPEAAACCRFGAGRKHLHPGRSAPRGRLEATDLVVYTEILDFQRRWPSQENQETANGIAHLVMDGAELQLSRQAGDGAFGSLHRVFVEDVDERYATFRARGLGTTKRSESPIHTEPVNQTWGLRVFAVTEPDGNGLCFCAPMR